MARKQRIHVSGGLYHVSLNGNSGQNIAYGDEDWLHAYTLLEEGVERFNYQVHAFCMLQNQIHLAIQISDISLSKIIQNFSFRYTRWINGNQQRTGQLFHGRYRATLIDSSCYLLDVVRHIHRQPVIQGISKTPESYTWTGHRAYLDKDNIPWLSTKEVLGQFAKRPAIARRKYSEFIAAQKSAENSLLNCGRDRRVMGDDKFLRSALKRKPKQIKTPSLTKIVRAVCRYYGVKERELADISQKRAYSEARNVIAWLAVECNAATLTEVGRRFNRDGATMSSGAQRLRERRKKDKEIAKTLRLLVGELKVR
ncbi:MAG: transposase [Gammaproteobacteria bacterium]|nr:transposase [Gammaproteobacteria bacterium]